MPEIPRKTFRREMGEISVGWPKTLLLVSLFLVLAALAVSFALEAYRGSLVNTSASIDSDIRNIIADLPRDEVGKLLTLDSQIRNLLQLLPKHVAASRLLEEIGRNTLPQVRWEQLSLDVLRGKLMLDGSSPNFMIPSLQTEALAKASFAAEVSLDKAAIGEKSGDVKFTIAILLKPGSLLFAQ